MHDPPSTPTQHLGEDTFIIFIHHNFLNISPKQISYFTIMKSDKPCKIAYLVYIAFSENADVRHSFQKYIQYIFFSMPTPALLPNCTMYLIKSSTHSHSKEHTSPFLHRPTYRKPQVNLLLRQQQQYSSFAKGKLVACPISYTMHRLFYAHNPIVYF